MRSGRRVVIAVSCGLLLSAVGLVRAADPSLPLPTVDPARIGTVIQQLSSIPSRIPGTLGNQLAAGFVEMTFREIGLQNVRSEEFEVVSPIDLGARLELPGDEVAPIYCVWPNFARTSKVSPEGVSGEIIYGGDGRTEFLNGKPIKDAIVLFEFNSSTRWLDAVMLGANAIIFIEPEEVALDQSETKFLSVPVSVPRFWLPREGVEQILGQVAPGSSYPDRAESLKSLGKTRAISGTVFADMKWKRGKSRNIFGDVPGTDPGLKDQIVIIESYYDSTSVVPALAPGAEQSCGMAGLLELARYFVANPPRRTVRFMATGGHFNALAGTRSWVQDNYYRDEKQQRKNPTEPDEVFFGLDLSSATSHVGLFCRGFFYEQMVESTLTDENMIAKRFFDFSSKFGTYLKNVPPEAKQAQFIDAIKPPSGKEWRSFLPTPLAFDSEVYSLVGKEGMTFATAGDPRQRVDSPLDTFDKVDPESVAAQVGLIAPLLYQAANDPDFSFGKKRFEEFFANAFGVVIEDQLVGGYLPLKVMPNVLVACSINADASKTQTGTQRKTIAGVRGTTYTFTDEFGRFEIDGIHQTFYWVRPQQAPVSSFLFDPEDGSIVATTNRMPLGEGVRRIQLQGIQRARDPYRRARKTDVRIPIFNCVATAVFDVFDQRYLRTINDRVVLLDGESNSELNRARFYLGWASQWKSYSEPVAVFFTERDTDLKMLLYSGQGVQQRVRMALLNSTPEVPEGEGFVTTDREDRILYTQLRAAQDMWTLDEARISEMAKYGVKNIRVNELHRDAKEAIEAAEKRLAERDYEGFIRAAREASALESRAYPEVRKTQDDVVKGVVFYFALLIPFVAFMERLTFCFADIRKQLAAMLGIFIAIYLVLDRVHPAFRISTAPILVVLSFFIMAIGFIVTVYLLSKFGEHMEKLRARTAIIHRADVGRLSSAVAAFSLGVSNMKKRKIRTTLTCATLSLLGFTVISFVSFSNVTKFNRRQTLVEPLYQGALIRDTNWKAIEDYAFLSIVNDFRDKADVIVGRAWIMSDNNREMYVGISRSDDPSKNFVGSAVVGLDQAETDVTHIDDDLKYGHWFTAGESDECIINLLMAGPLGVTPDNYGDVTLDIFGREFRIAGVISEDAFADRLDLDDEPLTPVDFDAMEEFLKEQEAAALTTSGTESASLEIEIPQAYAHLQPGGILILPRATAEELGATMRSISLAFGSAESTREALDGYVPRLGLIVYAGIGDQTYLLSSRGGLSVKGLADLMVPIAIAALIVFNTMLGAVYERANEIRIYSSVGLAPTHVAALFIAESCVYATIGAIFGYLLGQISAKIITMNDLLPGLALNYSSTSAVVATIVVIAVVLLSTLYPARVAAMASVADQGRKMRIPRPKGDNWKFDFPFTVSRREGLGLASFIKDYFDENDEDSGVKFAAENNWLEESHTEHGPAYSLHGLVWLAPFDMGISQQTTMHIVPDPEDERVDKIVFEFHRESGEITAWQKMNLGFIKEMRKQLLIWRIVKPEHKDLLTEKGRELVSSVSKPESTQPA